MTYEELLAAAPAHETPEFLEYLRKNNKVVHEDEDWLVIENAKYHTPDRAWFTAFVKDGFWGNDWMIDIKSLILHFGGLTWKKKSPKDQTVRRPHVHLYEESSND